MLRQKLCYHVFVTRYEERSFVRLETNPLWQAHYNYKRGGIQSHIEAIIFTSDQPVCIQRNSKYPCKIGGVGIE